MSLMPNGLSALWSVTIGDFLKQVPGQLPIVIDGPLCSVAITADLVGSVVIEIYAPDKTIVTRIGGGPTSSFTAEGRPELCGKTAGILGVSSTTSSLAMALSGEE